MDKARRMGTTVVKEIQRQLQLNQKKAKNLHRKLQMRAQREGVKQAGGGGDDQGFGGEQDDRREKRKKTKKDSKQLHRKLQQPVKGKKKKSADLITTGTLMLRTRAHSTMRR